MGGEAISSNLSDGFNFAGRITDITSSNNAQGFNFAVTDDLFDVAINTNDGDDDEDQFYFNVAIGRGPTTFSRISMTNTNSNNNINFANAGSTITLDGASASPNGINFATAGTTLTNPGEGVNIDVGNGELRLFNISSVGSSSGNSLELNGNVVQEVTSTRKHKKHITTLNISDIERALQLRPVSFSRRQAPDGQIEYGLIAEDTAKVIPEIVTYDSNGEPNGISYRQLAVLLLNVAQKQQHKLHEYEQENQQLREVVHDVREQNAQHEQDITRLYQLVGALRS